MARGVAQSAVWDEVRAKSSRHRVASPTGAQGDIFKTHEKELEALRNRFKLERGQSGAIFAVADRLCLDYVSQPEAFARLYPKLLDGYLLDAIEWLDHEPAGYESFAAHYLATQEAPRSRRPSAGLGTDVRLRGYGVVGSRLELDGELIQLCSFSSESADATTTIAQPSRRRT
jgi:ARG/rhodanese/phosphatase superfamily protein